MTMSFYNHKKHKKHKKCKYITKFSLFIYYIMPKRSNIIDLTENKIIEQDEKSKLANIYRAEVSRARQEPQRFSGASAAIKEAQRKATEEPILGSYFHATILNHKTFGDALSFRLASKLDNPMLPTMLIRDVIAEAAEANNDILSAAEIDIIANYTRDPACRDLSSAFLLLKGYHALQAHRIAHWLWRQERHTLAQFFQNQISVTLVWTSILPHASAAASCSIMQRVSSLAKPLSLRTTYRSCILWPWVAPAKVAATATLKLVTGF